MDSYQNHRGRSTSASRQRHSIPHSPSPHSQPFQQTYDPTFNGATNYSSSFASTQAPPQQYGQQQYHSNSFPSGTRHQSDPNVVNHTPNSFAFNNNSYSASAQDSNIPDDLFASTGTFDGTSSLDAPLQEYNNNFGNLDTGQLDDFLTFNNQFNDPSYAFSDMSTTHQQAPQAPHMLQPDMRHTSYDQQHVPADYSALPQHSPNTLDPSSAAFPLSAQWTNHRGHRRTPSDQYSDVSSHGNTPYLDAVESFESFPGDPSPMLNGAGDASVFGPDALGLDHFSLNDPSQHVSPGHSSHPSPFFGPQDSMFAGQEGLGFDLGSSYQTDSAQEHVPPAEPFPTMPQLQHQDSQNRGEADQMSPPEIRFEPAPPSKQNSHIDMEQALNNVRETTLSPPQSVNSRPGGRQRAITHPHGSGRSSRDASPQRPRSPSLGLTPTANLEVPRSRSGSRGSSGRIEKPGPRRGSSPSRFHHRSPEQEEAMLKTIRDSSPHGSSGEVSEGNGLASSPGSASGYEGSPEGRSTSKNHAGRKQKHPATFECHLCEKRFTRAYNLRSHLRTHTDERPFVCTVCGKAFARQHDRKRHEGLHSGEKKFVCRGDLQHANGTKTGTWGCGRRFARADALGRHFRSEAGRACIKPLLDEEARHRRQDAMEQQNAQYLTTTHNGQMGQNTGMPPTSMPMEAPNIDVGNMPLPAALLAQYPALAGIDLSTPINIGASDYDYSDYEDPSGAEYDDMGNSARSSFDAPRSSYEGNAFDTNGFVNQQQMPMDPNLLGQGMGQQQWHYQQ